MRIAQIAPIVESVPPKKYGGTERVVSALTEELVRRGHEVTLFASGDSVTSAKLVSVTPRSIRDSRLKDIYGPNYWTMLNIGVAYERQGEFDIIHDHNGHLSLPTANCSHTPVVMTLHGSFDPINKQFYSRLGKKISFVFISKMQEKLAPNMNKAGVVYNGLNMKDFPFSSGNDGYLLFVGRLSLEKGAHIAIEVSQLLNIPLIMAAKLDFLDMPFFQEYIGPNLSSQVRWVGEVDQNERNKLMSRALALLHPVTWPEPFGLTMIESMACGTPVIAFRNGSIPEVVKNGRTGFVVEDIDGMINAVPKLPKIDRKHCRQYALEKFNGKKMTDGYIKIYEEIIRKNSLNLPP
ncbi:glycosyltransferase family 4 protein [Patescibacteria group bacterium]|nr:glycosyltransferase family 4 protein [Patescibacteria group bacterium]